MDRNTLITLALSFLLVIAYTIFYPMLFPEDFQQPQTDKKEVQKKENKEQAKKNNSENQSDTKQTDTAAKSDTSNPSTKPAEKTITAAVSNYNVPVQPASDFDPLTEAGKKKIKDIELESDVYKIKFTSLDAAVRNIRLKNYKDENGKDIDAVFEHGKKKVLPLATSFRNTKNLKKKISSAYEYATFKYQHDSKKLSLNDDKESTLENANNYSSIILDKIEKNIKRYSFKDKGFKDLNIILFRSVYQTKSGDKLKNVEFLKIYSLHKEDYLIDLDIVVKNLYEGESVLGNNDSGDLNASFYIHWGESLGPYYNTKEKTTYDDVIRTSYLTYEKNEDGDLEEIDENKTDFTGFKWVGIDSRYLVTCLIPEWETEVKKNGSFKVWDKKNYFGEIYNSEEIKKSNEEIIGLGYRRIVFQKANESKDYHISVFVAPKTRRLIKEDHYQDFNIDKVREGWFIVLIPLEWGIEWLLFTFNNLVNNFGYAIILLTVVLKIVLHPLTKKSLDSTQKMQELGPKMKEIEKKYKDNSQKKQQAIMELYKKEGINPLGGCLPIVLQMPIFFALYNVLPSLLELKNADFLWIHDLSSPDTVGEIDTMVFDMLNINILPIIMTITSVIQMKMMATPTTGNDEKAQTAKMMQYMMPIIFLFIFWTMPSGLVLYWTVQNILQVGQQYYTKIMGKKKKENVEKK